MENSGKSALGLDVNVAAGLAYLPVCLINLILSIAIIATDKTNKFARFAAFQSLLLIGIGIGGSIVGMIVGALDAVAQIGVFALLGTLIYIGSFAIFIIGSIICCIQAFMGKQFKLPVIGNMADNWSN
ncbi:MAG: hypothetical protein KBD94_10875 [Pyrinomonadaceae bacterium]|nr:hypothetical protein [Pyrinomonadaceae bacterium]